MRQVQSAEFRTTFATYDEPVQVMKYKQVLGTWVPGGMNPVAYLGTLTVDVADTEPVVAKMGEAQKVIDMQADEIKELKRLLAANAKPGPALTMSSMIAPESRMFGVPKPAPKPGKAK